MEFRITYVIAKNDVNGNPRRGWYIEYPSGKSEFVDEGYGGNMALYTALVGPFASQSDQSYADWSWAAHQLIRNAHTERMSAPVATWKAGKAGVLDGYDIHQSSYWIGEDIYA